MSSRRLVRTLFPLSFVQVSIDLYAGAIKSEAHRHGTATITSHRVIWRGDSGPIQWLLSQVRSSLLLFVCLIVCFIASQHTLN